MTDDEFEGDLVTSERMKQSAVYIIKNTAGRITKAREEYPLAIDALFELGMISQKQRGAGLQYIAIRSFSLRQQGYASNNVYTGGISRDVVKDDQDETMLVLTLRNLPNAYKPIIKEFCEEHLTLNDMALIRRLAHRYGVNYIQKSFETLADCIAAARDEIKTRG